MKNFNGLLVVNIELSSRCNKKCWCCGRRKIEKEFPSLANWGDMNFELVKSIAKQLPEGIIVQFHNNGEGLLYPRFGEAVKLFKNQIKCIDSNGKLLIKKADEIIDNLDTLTISVIENDKEGDEQYEIVKKFLEIKDNRKPLMIYRLLGDVAKYKINNKEILDIEKEKRWYKLSGIIATRVLHSEYGSYDYTKKVTIPETGICWDILSHLVIDRFGNIYPCIRFNPKGLNCLGNAKYLKLIKAWNSPKRLYLIQEHLKGNRNCSELCSKCEYWGIPRGE